MQSAEDSLGEVLTDSPPQLRYFAVPTLSLMAVVVGGAAYTGLGGLGARRVGVRNRRQRRVRRRALWGTFTMVAVALVMGVGSGIANLDEAMETVIDGFSMMLTALTILVMAWTIGSVTTALGTGIYVTNIAENFVTPTLLPVVVLVASAFIAFSTGTSWGTMAIVTPIAVPLAWSVGGATPALLPSRSGPCSAAPSSVTTAHPSPTRRSSRRRSPVPTTSITSAPRCTTPRRCWWWPLRC